MQFFPPPGSASTQTDFFYIGGRLIADPDTNGIFQLHGRSGGIAQNYSSMYYNNGAGAKYVVPANKVLYVLAARIVPYTQSTGGWGTAYADNDVGNDSTVAPTNIKYYGGAANGQYVNTLKPQSLQNYFNTQDENQIATDFTIPAGKYVYTWCSANNDIHCTLWCKLVNA